MRVSLKKEKVLQGKSSSGKKSGKLKISDEGGNFIAQSTVLAVEIANRSSSRKRPKV